MDEAYARFSRLLIDRPHPRVLRVVMNRPDKLNATDGEMHSELTEIWRVIAAVRESGIATVVVDKTVAAILSVVDRSTVLVKGSVVSDGLVMDALTFADMTTGPAGQPMTLEQRIEEVQRRYRSDNPVHRAIVRARP